MEKVDIIIAQGMDKEYTKPKGRLPGWRLQAMMSE